MVDDRLEDAGSLPESGRVKRAPPTIDLDASEISSETKALPETPSEPKLEPKPDAEPEPAPGPMREPEPEETPERPKAAASPPVSRPISPWVIVPSVALSNPAI